MVDVLDAVKSRKSIRGYKPTAVPKEVLEDIITRASRSPSSMNTQPWEITVVTGDILEKIKEENLGHLASGIQPEPDISATPYEGKWRQRQVELGVQLFQLMGIAREDKEKRAQWMQRAFRFFDAPAVIIVSDEKSVNLEHSLLAIGSLAQTICLIALHYGLGTCIQDRGIAFPDVVRKYTSIPESQLVVLCIIIGYPDWDFPANNLESKRESLETFVTWCGFE